MDPNKPQKSPLYAPPTAAPFVSQWSTGLFDCWDDRHNCWFSAFCPCITTGQIVEILDGGTTSSSVGCLLSCAMSSIHCGWLYGRKYRLKLRKLFSLPEAPCSDLWIHCCCCLCGICQEFRELKHRGFDPSIGWEANIEKRKHEGVKEPPVRVLSMAR